MGMEKDGESKEMCSTTGRIDYSPSNKNVSSFPKNKLIKLNDGIIDEQTRNS